jgi:hypothetical protein
MPELTIDKLKPGMVLARNAVHVNGRVLLEAGSNLAPNHLRMLKAWGVYSVHIETGGVAPVAADDHPEPDDPDRYRAAYESVAPRFRHADLSHPVIAELFRFRVGKSL